jgi:hypothetical protein
LLKQK